MNKMLMIIENAGWYIRSLFWKRDKDIVLFGSWFGDRFADNSRYLFQYLSENKEKYHFKNVVWVSCRQQIVDELNEMGYEAYLMDSPDSIYFHKKAGYHLISNSPEEYEGKHGDIMGRYSHGAIKINLWHGVLAVKGVNMASRDYKNYRKAHPLADRLKKVMRHRSRLFRTFFVQLGGWGDCEYLSVTRAGTRTLEMFFDLPHDHYIETGQPRLLGGRLKADEEAVLTQLKQFDVTFLYVPTFRSTAAFDFDEASRAVAGLLQKYNIGWIQKPHSAATNSGNSHIQNINIINLPAEFDLNVLIPEVDALVTDYSSVSIDAMYYWKPVFYYVPDIEEYAGSDRGFIVKPRKVMVSELMRDTDTLCRAVEEYARTRKFEITDQYKLVRRVYTSEVKSYDAIWNDLTEKSGTKKTVRADAGDA